MPRNVLIVDDQDDILLILEREFRRRPDLTVFSAKNVTDALMIILEKQINLVISDIRIGPESGFDLVREINRSFPHVSSTLMSASRSPANRQQAAQLGVVMFLEKPFQVPKLLEEIENHFNRVENPAPAPEPEPVPVAATPAPVPAALESTGLAHFKPQDLVQLFCLNGRNIQLSVTTEIAVGQIYIQRGRVVHAEYGNLSGEDAFHSIMHAPNPQLKVSDWDGPVPVSIKTSWEYLLLQSAIQFDHRVDSGDLPQVQKKLG